MSHKRSLNFWVFCVIGLLILLRTIDVKVFDSSKSQNTKNQREVLTDNREFVRNRLQTDDDAPRFAVQGPESIQSDEEIFDQFGYPLGKTYQYISSKNHIIPNLVKFDGVRSKDLKIISGMELRREAFDSLMDLKEKAGREGIPLTIGFAYRKLATQKKLFWKFGGKVAEKPGYSEHHLGTTVDFTRVKFTSLAFLWLLKNGISAGWVPSYYYREESEIQQEPWHWRYVGQEASKAFFSKHSELITLDIKHLETLKKQGKLRTIQYLAKG